MKSSAETIARQQLTLSWDFLVRRGNTCKPSGYYWPVELSSWPDALLI